MVSKRIEQGAEPPPGRGLYCNRTLNFRSIKVVGYDMDYTLIHYHVEDWERRAYQHLHERLLQARWPVKGLEFDPGLVARGLVIDTELGNILKANRFGYIKTAYHGSRRMEREQLRKAYARTVIDLSDPRYRFLNTLFALSEGCMFAQLVDRLDEGRFSEPVGYHDLYREVRQRVDATHMEGRLKAEIIANPEKFVELDPDTVLALLDQKQAGMRLVLITNSEWTYTAAMMKYAIDRFLPEGTTWRDLFELVVVAARKPSFFESSAPLLEVMTEEGLLQPTIGALRDGGCYFGGNASQLEAHLGVSGDEILYLGDHMYGDVHVTKNVLRWRTGLILRELEAELAAVEAAREGQAQLAALMCEKEACEAQQSYLRLLQQRRRAGYGPSVKQSGKELGRELAEIRIALSKLDEKIAPLAVRAGEAHSSRWGLLMRAGRDKSQLARQIERYADFYTSRVSNLLYATPFAYLRSRLGSLPHDPAE